MLGGSDGYKSGYGINRSNDGFIDCLGGVQANSNFGGFVGRCRTLTYNHVRYPWGRIVYSNQLTGVDQLAQCLLDNG